MSAGNKRQATALGRGFTLIEALVAVTLLVLGIVSTMGALGTIAHTEAYAREKEKLQRLAAMKYREVIATGESQNAMANGDFQDYNIDGYTWESTVEPSGVENLNALTVTVTKTARPLNNLSEKVEGLLFVPPETGTTGGVAQ